MNVHDQRPDAVYGILVRAGRVFVASYPGGRGVPGGAFRPLADDRKVELRAHLWDQLGLETRAVWAQGAFLYRHPREEREQFAGFYTVWEWDGEPPAGSGEWLDERAVVAAADLPASLRILLTTVLNTIAIRTR